MACRSVEYSEWRTIPPKEQPRMKSLCEPSLPGDNVLFETAIAPGTSLTQSCHTLVLGTSRHHPLRRCFLGMLPYLTLQLLLEVLCGLLYSRVAAACGESVQGFNNICTFHYYINSILRAPFYSDVKTSNNI